MYADYKTAQSILNLKMKNSYFLRAMALVAILFTFALNLKAQTYPLSDSQLAAKIAAKQQLTDVPTIYIDIPSITNETELSEQLYKDRNTNYAPYLTGTITVVDNSAVGSTQHLESFTDEVQIKVRGNSTASVGNKKRPYRLKFASKSTAPDGVAHKHDLLGLGYAKRNWVLLANAVDKTMMRNAVTYHLGKYVGMKFTPGYKFVDLVISGIYRGTYQVSDHPEIGSNRMPGNELSTWYLEFADWTNMLEEPYISSDVPKQVSIKNPDADDMTAEEIEQLKTDVHDYLKLWGNSFYSDSWMSYNDMESFVNYFVATEITGDLDAYFVFKTTKDAGSDKMVWPMIWDKDLAYGNYTAPETLTPNYGKTTFEYCFKGETGLFKNKKFLKLVNDKLNSIIEDGLYDKLCNDIDNLYTLFPGSRTQNFNKYSLSENLAGEVFCFADYDEHVQALKDFLRNRITLVQTEIQKLITGVGGVDDVVIDDGGGGQGGEVVTGLTYLGKGVKWGGNELVYVYQGSKQTMVENATVTITFDTNQTFNSYQLYLDSSPYTAWKSVYWPATLPVSFTLTADDVAALAASGYKFTIITTNDNNPEVHVTDVTISGGNVIVDPDDPTERTQLTNLPTIYIDTQDGAEIEPSTGNYIHAKMQIIDANGTLSQDTEEFDYMEIRGRGTDIWTGTDKKSYRIKFAKQHKHDLMGKGYSKRNWALLANAGDKSLMRNALTNELGTAIGMPFTPGYCFVDLVLNDEYVGTYQVSDQIQADANRVNINEDTGWLVEMTKEANVSVDDVYVEGSENMPWIVVNNPEYANYADQEAFKATVSEFVTNLLNDNSGAYIDLTSFVNWYIATEILGGYQSLSDIYAYKENAAETLSFGPLWNNDFSFNNSSQIDMSGNGLMSDLNNDESFNGLVFNAAENSVWKAKLATLWQQEWFKQAVLEKWNQIYTGANSGIAKTLIAKVETMANKLNQSQALNFSSEAGGAGWTLTGQGVTGVSRDNTFNFANYTAAVAQLKTYIQERLPYLDRKFNALANAQQQQFVAVNYEVDKQAAQTFYNEYVGEQADVTILNRKTIQGGEWNAITFPFNASRDVINDVFGADCQLRALSSVQTVSAQNIVFTFEEVTGGVEAGVPYIIYPSSDVTNLTFNGVDFDCSFAQTVEKDGYLLVGTLQPTDIKADNRTLIFSTANKLLKLNQDTQINGARAYITIPESASNANSFSIGIEEADGIKVVGVEANKNNGYIYNINGQLEGKTMKNMPKGVYVVNGRKVIK